jgi:putative mRNA 3-end processing factor
MGVDPSIGPLIVHGAVEPLNRAYRAAGVAIPRTQLVTEIADKALIGRALVVAPPSVQGSPWTRRFGDYSDAFASGWMQLRGARRRRSVDRGFVLRPCRLAPACSARSPPPAPSAVIVTHGYEAVMVRWLESRASRARRDQYGDNDDDELVARRRRCRDRGSGRRRQYGATTNEALRAPLRRARPEQLSTLAMSTR